MKPDEIVSNYFKHLQRGQLLMDVERWREALHEFSQHLSAHPDNYDAMCQSALCHLRLKEYQQAYDTTKRAIELAPEGEWAYRLQSIIFNENGEPKRAIEAAKMSVEKAPYFWQSHNCLFWAQAEYGDYDGAEKALNTLLEMAPGDYETQSAAAYLALKRKRYEEAEKLYLETLKLNPESINALNNLGTIYLHYAQTGKGRHYKQMSIDMFERAVRLQPTFKLGQQNISTASNALKFGLPAGGFFLVWAALRLIGGLVGSFTSSTSPTHRSQGGSSGTTNWIATPSYLLTGTNIYFLLIVTGLILLIASLFVKRFREPVLYELFTFRGWGILSGAFGLSLLLYITAMWVLDINGTPLSGLGLVVSFIVVFYSGISLIRVRNTRRQLKGH